VSSPYDRNTIGRCIDFKLGPEHFIICFVLHLDRDYCSTFGVLDNKVLTLDYFATGVSCLVLDFGVLIIIMLKVSKKSGEIDIP
jgi:hypothetical protein